ncbi:MAG: ImmA/IrrE family metallo-endopeptidase [Opitutaceae bacterium]|nr:ImmA/IrrE family metallo-endopeptidase [Opitutaceae bacterium]
MFDLAEQLGLEVRFLVGNSFGGMFAKATNVVLVPSLRPPGRQAFTAAHELGHWYFGHGDRLDHLPELDPDAPTTPEERLANLFAAYLLMPPWSVARLLARRGWIPSSATPLQLFTISAELGVGYETLIRHLCWSLDQISPSKARELIKVSPKAIRSQIAGEIETKHLVVVDSQWAAGNIDLQVGHAALLPKSIVLEGSHVAVIADLPAGTLVQGRKPGITRSFLEGVAWAKFIRVSRADFEGRSIYRHMEDPDVD